MSVIAKAISGAEYMGLRGLTKHEMLGRKPWQEAIYNVENE